MSSFEELQELAYKLLSEAPKIRKPGHRHRWLRTGKQDHIRGSLPLVWSCMLCFAKKELSPEEFARKQFRARGQEAPG